FSNSGLTRLKKSFLNSSVITHLFLTDNDIWEIEEGAFDSLPNLVYLNLTGNLIPFNELNFGNESKIEELVLDNAIKNPDYKSYAKDVAFKPGVSMKLKKLRSLYLRNNNIKDIELDHLTLLKEIMPSLAYLYLDNNRISSANFVEFLPSTLTHLYLTNNNISKFKSRFLRNLKLLMLDRNPIKHLCGSKIAICDGLTLNSAVNLQVLSLSRIELQDVQVDSFRDLENLLFLDLSHNEIYQILDHTFDNLPSLRILHLDHNDLDTVPDTCGLKNLEYLSITFNRIKAIDSS
ncbi:GSCOCG00006438001-RA-CDS, partial [Cotesia congregata]